MVHLHFFILKSEFSIRHFFKVASSKYQVARLNKVPSTKYQVQSRDSHFSPKFVRVVIPISSRIPNSTFKNQRPAFDIEKIDQVSSTKYHVQTRDSHKNSNSTVRRYKVGIRIFLQSSLGSLFRSHYESLPGT
jgi:hypothetical protein